MARCTTLLYLLRMACDVCRTLPAEVEVSYLEGGPAQTLPAAASALSCANAVLAEVGVRQCPGCRAYFLHHAHVPGGSEDFQQSWHIETLRRATLRDVLAAVRAEIKSLRTRRRLEGPFADQLVATEADLAERVRRGE